MRAHVLAVAGLLLMATAAPALASDVEAERRRMARPITPATCERISGGTFDPRTRTCLVPIDGDTGENITTGPDRVVKIN